MTLSYNFGLTAGSLLAYVFKAMLGAPLTDPCGTARSLSANSSVYYYTTLLPEAATSLPTTTLTTTLSSVTTIATNISTALNPLNATTSV